MTGRAEAISFATAIDPTVLFVRRVRAMGIRDQPISPRSPWQNGYAERLIGYPAGMY